jgi:hypothetical protein
MAPQRRRRAHHRSYLESFDELRAQGHEIMEAYAAVAKRLNVSPKTIQRAVVKRKRQG